MTAVKDTGLTALTALFSELIRIVLVRRISENPDLRPPIAQAGLPAITQGVATNVPTGPLLSNFYILLEYDGKT